MGPALWGRGNGRLDRAEWSGLVWPDLACVRAWPLLSLSPRPPHIIIHHHHHQASPWHGNYALPLARPDRQCERARAGSSGELVRTESDPGCIGGCSYYLRSLHADLPTWPPARPGHRRPSWQWPPALRRKPHCWVMFPADGHLEGPLRKGKEEEERKKKKKKKRWLVVALWWVGGWWHLLKC